jgi:hypothetical protein
LAEEREKDGHGVFTKALIDCLCEPRKECITVDDWYDFAFNRLKISGNQTPRIRNSREGDAIEIGNFKKKLDRLAEQEREQLILKARDKLNNLVSAGVLHEKEVEWWVHLLELGENLSLRNRQSRDDLIRFLKGEIDPWRVFGRVREIDEHPPPPGPEPPELDEDGEPPKPLLAAAPIPPEPPIATAPAPPEPPVLDPPVTPSAPEVLPGTSGGRALPDAKKFILVLPPTRALFVPVVFAIGVVALAVYFFVAPDNKNVSLEDEKQASRASTFAHRALVGKSVRPSLVVDELGMGFASLNDDTRAVFNLGSYYAYGVVVTNVDPGSAAADKHIQPGNLLRTINDKTVNDPADVAKIMQALKRDGKRNAEFTFNWPRGTGTLPLSW